MSQGYIDYATRTRDIRPRGSQFLTALVSPLVILTKPFKVKSFIVLTLTVVYIAGSMVIFFQWVNPTLTGQVDQHIAADSTVYIGFADALRSRNADPILLASLFTFPNTLLCPVALALLFKSTFSQMVADYLMFFLALALLRKSVSFAMGPFLALLLLNATTTISLLSVNKEIVDLLAISLFLFARYKRHGFLLLLAILLAAFNRFEVAVVMLCYVFANSKLNPFRQKRAVALIALVFALSVLLPLALSKDLNQRFEEAEGGHTIALLDALEMHYMYWAAVIPKTAECLFGELLSFYSRLQIYQDGSDLANSYIILSNNVANVVVLCVLMWRRRLTVSEDLTYFAFLGWIIMSIALVIQPRYIYFAYVLLCLEATRISDCSPA